MAETNSEIDEQKILQEAVKELKDFGEVSIEFITGILNPHAGSVIPDLVFTPKSGPNQDGVYIVELKFTDNNFLPSVVISNARAYKDKLKADNPELKLNYAISSNAHNVPDSGDSGVKILVGINDAAMLVKQVLAWADIDNPSNAKTAALSQEINTTPE